MEKSKQNSLKRLSQIPKEILVIHHGKKKYRVDLNEELKIDENIIDGSLRKSPSNYALLVLVRDKLIYERDTLEKEKDQAYSKAWLYYKESGNLSNEAASHKAEMNKAYQGCLERYQKAEYKANRLISICRAYENRENILRTISANLRKQQ